MKMIKETISQTLKILLVMTVLLGILYPAVMTGIGQLAFKDQVNGSVIEIDGTAYGSEMLGQRFSKEENLWGRIMLPDTGTYTDAEGSALFYGAASNQSPAGDEFETAVAKRVAMIQEANPDADADAIPVELVTCSGSGLDPHISPAAAEYQVPRIAAARGMTQEQVQDVIDRYTKGRLFGVLGEKTVHVLKVNLALDGILTK